jgi:hypothetical protein
MQQTENWFFAQGWNPGMNGQGPPDFEAGLMDRKFYIFSRIIRL